MISQHGVDVNVCTEKSKMAPLHLAAKVLYIHNKEWQAIIIIFFLIGILPDSSQQDNLSTSSYQGQGVQDRVMPITVRH